MTIKHTVLAAIAVDRAMAVGDKKYGEKAWLNKKPNTENLDDHLAAMKRHIKRFEKGEVADESGEQTLAHIVARGMLALEFLEMERLANLCKTNGPGVTGKGRAGMDTVMTCTLQKGHNGPHFDGGWHAHWD